MSLHRSNNNFSLYVASLTRRFIETKIHALYIGLSFSPIFHNQFKLDVYIVRALPLSVSEIRFENAVLARASLFAPLAYSAMLYHEDVKPILKFIRHPQIEVRLRENPVCFRRDPSKKLAKAEYVCVDGKGIAAQTEQQHTRRRLWANAVVGHELLHDGFIAHSRVLVDSGEVLQGVIPVFLLYRL